jgi:hypothetical protein
MLIGTPRMGPSVPKNYTGRSMSACDIPLWVRDDVAREEELGRRWIGIDNAEVAIEMAERRLISPGAHCSRDRRDLL